MNDQVPPPEDSPNAPRAGKASRSSLFARHSTLLLWMVVLGALLWFQWPMIKGWGYRLTGSKAPDDGIGWRTDFAAAITEAQRVNKPLLLDFSASWCPPCQVMKHDVWPDAAVRGALLAGYVPVLVDVDAAGNEELSARYAVSSIPTIIIVNVKGEVLKRGSFMTASEMAKFLGPGA